MWTRMLRVSRVVSLQTTLLLAFSTTLMCCASRTVGLTRSARAATVESSRPLGLDLYRPEPADNPTVPATVTLGRRLFRERLLSRDRSLACVDCHRPDRAFTDGRARSVGVYGRRGPRSVPTIVNRAWGTSFFWDGRIATLEEQVLEPILAELEMDLSIEEAVERLRVTSPYPAAFRETFGRDLNRDDLARALAAYVRTIQSGASPYDRYVWGEPDALSQEAQAGLRLFRGRASCTVCHVGPNFTDEEFHNTGVFWGGQPYDAGRFLVTGATEDTGKFKTPTLREVARTAPYMHDGSIATLEEVVEFYDRGGNDNPFRDRELRPLMLTEDEKEAILAFLQSLSGQIVEGLEYPAGSWSGGVHLGPHAVETSRYFLPVCSPSSVAPSSRRSATVLGLPPPGL